MASYVTPKRGVQFIFYIGLVSQSNTKIFQANPTLAAGDVKISKDGGALANLNTLPDVDPDNSKVVKVTVSATEMESDNAQIIFSDAAGDEWCDLIINIQTTARQIDDLAWPTTTGRSIDVTATGAVGIDWANVENPTTTINFSGTTVKTATDIATQITALNNLSAAQVNAEVLDVVGTDVIADSVAADGSRPTIMQAMLMVTRFLMERSVVSTTMTVNKENGSTASMTFTLNDATNPTSITRAS